MNTQTRKYDSSKRKAQAEARKLRIAECAARIMRDRDFADFTLDEVALCAETTVQTILRAYGSKEELFVTALSKHSVPGVDLVLKDAMESGDVPRIVAAIFGVYEKIGDAVIRMLAEEPRIEGLKATNDIGRDFHRNFVTVGFDRHLAPLPPGQRQLQYHALLAATDIYIWQILRRSEGLSLTDTIETVTHLITRLIKDTDQ